MSIRQILIIILILITLIIPLIELSIGFYYVNSINLCPIQHDIMLLMSIGGVFNIVFFAAAFAFIFSITPARFKSEKQLSSAEIMAKGSNRANQILIGCITIIFACCALTFFVLLQIRVFSNYNRVQWKTPTQSNYCQFSIYFSAFGLIIAVYVAFVLFFVVSVLKLFGIGL